MGLGRSITNWFKAIGYLLTGRLDSAREVLDSNPHVIKAKFDEIIRDKVSRIQQYKKAVSSLVAQQEKKAHQVDTLTKEVQRLENLKAGAAAKARKSVEQLQQQGLGEAEIHANEDYERCLGAFNDFSSTLEEKQARIVELEANIGEYGKSIGDHKIQLQQLLRELDSLKAEASETVADIITAKEEREISDMISGIAEDGMAQELQRMRDLRQQVKANARISKEIAGTDTKAQEAEFLEYARTGVNTSEFDSLIGLGESNSEAPASTEAPESDGRLPE
jgi:chromosome segregation ATPase